MPKAKAEFAEYQRLRRAVKYPCMGCGGIGAATERYKATAAAAEIRCCKPCYDKIAAALQPEMPTPKPITETPADLVPEDHPVDVAAVEGLPDTYAARQAIADNPEYGMAHPARIALGKAIHYRQLELIGGGLNLAVAKAQAYKEILGRDLPRVRIDRLS